MCDAETPVILPGERIAFTRTIERVPLYYGDDEWSGLCGGNMERGSGVISNICPDWGMLLREGLLKRKEVVVSRYEREGTDRLKTLAETVSEAVDAVLGLAERYEKYAASHGEDEIASVFSVVPALPATTYREALQSLKFVYSALLFSGHYHVALGRFDRYMWPYVSGDVDEGRMSWDEVADLTAEFFVSLAKDSRLCPGSRPGEGGQSITIGGVDEDGDLSVNSLTYIIVDAASAIRFKDPKINLRVTQDTPRDLLFNAVALTRSGVSAPRYSNDSEVIPGLTAMGYDLGDARNYAVSDGAEFLIPGRGMDVVNVGAVSFPRSADAAIRAALASGHDFADIMEHLREDIAAQVGLVMEGAGKTVLAPAPLCSALMTDQLETRGDMSEGAKYNNLGIHGLGSVNAADALAAVKKFVYDDGSVTAERFIAALDDNYAHDEELCSMIANDAPKTGGGDLDTDDILRRLFVAFAEACERYNPVNGRWNRVRPGAGASAHRKSHNADCAGMAELMPEASADGRRAGDYVVRGLSPARITKDGGPMSFLQTFSKIDYRRICNGGPITIELSDAAFRTPDSIGRVTDMVAFFALLGCSQLQINAMNVKDLMSACKHMDRHSSLMTKVWGWNVCFCDMSEEYRDETIRRYSQVV
jgi:formate C-acetyltransferase